MPPPVRPARPAASVVTDRARGTAGRALVVDTDPEKMPLPAGPATLVGGHGSRYRYPALMAGARLATLPVLVLFAVPQRHSIASAASTGTRG